MNSGRRAIAVLVAVLALGVAPVAHAAVDYSKNAAGGTYQPAVPPKADATVTSTDSDFSWADAAVGAGAALAMVLLAGAVRGSRGVRRTRPAART